MAGVGSLQVLTLIFCLSELVTVGVLVFSHGFLLTRQVIQLNSTCQDFTTGERTANGPDIECWLPPSFRKAVVLIIDALRYDFATYNASLKETEARPFQNKMPVFREILEARSGEARLIPFIADSPTTTMQRLKGLTTGSLPTFIDVSQNFASEEITEDNIVDQLVGSGKHVILLGDDTWGGLFPGRFHRSHMYPSFNVMDLHTVDNGILAHLDHELSRDDWDVIIGHFLGVDHCGHRYGPDHPEMGAKLKEMNQIVSEVAGNLQNDTILLVFGDHGMTKTGDHGGDSSDEIMSALFIYSPALNLSPSSTKRHHPLGVAQVDIVPTLALSLGVPIPYSSLGKVIDDILITKEHNEGEAVERQISALRNNAQQVKRYLTEYRSVGNEFPKGMWQKLDALNTKLESGLNDMSSKEQRRFYAEYLMLAKFMCEEVWARFSVSEMVSGLFILFSVLVLMGFVAASSFTPEEESLMVRRILFTTIGINLVFVLIPYVGVALLGYASSFVILTLVFINRDLFNFDKLQFDIGDYISCSLVILICLASLSNSYVNVENYAVAFVLSTLVMIQVFLTFLRRQRKRSLNILIWKNLKGFLNVQDVICVFSLLLVLASVRGSSWFWKCREEQPWCIPSQVHIPLSGLPQNLRSWRYFTSVFVLGLLVWLPRQWLTMCGNMNGSRLGILLINYVPIGCGILVAAYWALLAAPTLHNTPISDYRVVPPRLTYLFSCGLISALYIFPLLIYEVPPSRSSVAAVSDNLHSFIPHIYQTLREKFNERRSSDSHVPIVYGLATSVSAPLLSMLMALVIVIVLVAGDGIAPAILLLLTTAVTCLFVQALSSWRSVKNRGKSMLPSCSSLCIWFLLSLHGFYSTGHHATFPSLHWSAAFVGFEGDWGGNNLIPTLLVGLNTFSAQILFGLALPLVVLAPFAIGVVFPKLQTVRLDNDEVNRGEFTLVDKPEETRRALVFVAVSYNLLHVAKVLCTAVSAFILRRHLMVWKIFAPHFIFEAVGLLITNISVFVGICFTLRILNVLHVWMRKLSVKKS